MRYVDTLYWSQEPGRRDDTAVGSASEGALEEVAFELGLISAGGAGIPGGDSRGVPLHSLVVLG